MKQLIINGVTADIIEDTPISLTRQVNDLFDFENKRANLTNTFILPFTNVNKVIFENAELLNSVTDIFKSFFEVVLIQDYETIIKQGKGLLTKIDSKGYHLTIYWGNINLSTLLENKTLQDLDLTDLNHDWTLDNVKSFFLSAGEVAYPIYNPSMIGQELLDAGTSADPFQAERFIPFVKAYRIFLQIFEDLDITIDGDTSLIASELFSLYIPVSSKLFKPEYNAKLYFVKTSILGVIPITENYIFEKIYNPTTTVTLNHDFNTLTGSSSLFNQTTINSKLYYTYLVPETATYSLSFNSAIIIESLEWLTSILGEYTQTKTTTYTVSANIALYLWDGSTGTLVSYIEKDAETFTNVQIQKIDMPNISVRASLIAGQKLYARTELTFTSVSISNFKPRIYVSPITSLEVNADIMGFNSEWSLAKNLPPIKQIDFIKYVTAITGTVIQTNDDDTISFKQLENIIEATDEAQDLSDICESLDIVDLQPKLAQNNIFQYNNDATVDKTTGEGTLFITNETLEKKKVLYTAPFSASENETYTTPASDTIQVARIPYLQPTGLQWDTINARIVELVSSGTINVYYREGTGTAEIAPIKYIAQFNRTGLHFNAILNRNYTNYVRVMNEYRLCKGVFSLTSSKFVEIDMLKPIYLKQWRMKESKFVLERILR